MTVKAQTLEMQIRDQAIADELRALLARKRVNQSDMARDLGVSQTWISRRITGRTAMTPAELQVICEYIDEDMSRVLAAGSTALDDLRNGDTKSCLSHTDKVVSERMASLVRQALGGPSTVAYANSHI